MIFIIKEYNKIINLNFNNMKQTMTNKSIDEIINRDDYARLTKALKDRTEEIAVKVRRKMEDLDLDEIDIEGMTLIVKEYSADYGQYHSDRLSIERHFIDDDYDREYNEYLSLEDINESYYLAGDYKCRITGANNKEALKFLNSVKKIFEYLDDTESEQFNDVNKALEETKDL